jgi:glycosyltransferase involved in cell wall biosynthesis
VPATVFYWDRGQLPHALVARLFRPEQVGRLIYRGILGAGGQPPPELAAAYRTDVLPNTFLPRADYANQLKAVDVYVAPRTREGVGLTYLEALAMGKCVAGFDDATMSEYITHGADGFLFGGRQSLPLDLARLPEMQDGIERLRTEGRARWLRDLRNLEVFLRRPTLRTRRGTAWRLAAWEVARWLVDLRTAGRLLARGDVRGVMNGLLARLRLLRKGAIR